MEGIIMKKDLIIGAIGNYEFHQVRNWILSIRDSGFEGDVILVTYNVPDPLIQKISEYGVIVYPAKFDWFGQPVHSFEFNSGNCGPYTSENLVHNVRFFHFWRLLESLETQYDTVIHTDVRDVVFQQNPSIWIRDYMRGDVLCTSEGVQIKHENWNATKIHESFGPFTLDCLKENPVLCVGIFAAKYTMFKKVCMMIYLMAARNGFADQPSFNVLSQVLNYQITTIEDDWAIHCALSMEQFSVYKDVLIGNKPVFKDGLLRNNRMEPYVIIHQYDRVPEIQQYLESKYGSL